MDEAGTGWIGRSLRWPEVTGILVSAALAIVVSTSLQPILLGGLLAENRLTLVELGHAATAELIAMAAACWAASAFLKPDRIRLKAAAAGIGLVAANLLTMMASHQQILLARALSGACYGIYVCILAYLLVRSRNAARYAGLFTAIQAIISVALSNAFAAFTVSRFGINAGYACLALISLLVVLGSPLFPLRFDALPPENAGRIPSPYGFAGLGVIFFYLAGLVGVWVYVGAMSQQAGYTPQETGVAVSMALAAQFLGALVASVLGNRLRPIIAIVIGGLGGCVFAVTLTLGLPLAGFVAVVAGFGLLWMFSTPFLTPMIMEMDASRATTMYAITMQMLGAACGPAFGAMLVQGADVRQAIIGSSMLMVAATIGAVVIQLILMKRRPAVI